MSGLLAVVPARQGSKGIPGKALRTVGGVPMILRTLRTLKAANVAERIVVSTDWPELRDFCELRGFDTVARDPALATDEAPLSAVAADLVAEMDWQGDVGIFQPTCPLLKPGTIRDAVALFDESSFDWMISTTEDRHILWRNGETIGPRVNRQQAEPLQRESGAIQLMSREYALGHGGKQGLFAIDEREALDIDTPDDLVLAEGLAGLLRIHFVVASGHHIGTGHYHRCSHLARVLSHHALSWGSETELADDAVVTIFDRLEVPPDDLLEAKARGKVVVLEDEGADSGKLADLRVNEMLDHDDLRYAVLREEFCCLPERDHREDANRVLVTFGGTDPAGLCERMGQELSDWQTTKPNGSMARVMREADLIVTGQGRTVLEAAACGTPCISIAANEREARHIRLPGVTYLGLHATVPASVVQQAVKTTLGSVELRREMSKTARGAFDDRGADRLARAIEELIV